MAVSRCAAVTVVLGLMAATAAAAYVFTLVSSVRTVGALPFLPSWATSLLQTPTSPHLRVATYNTCLLPFPVAHDGQRRVNVMTSALPSLFHDADVLVLCEMISHTRSHQLLRALAETWPHQSSTIRTWGRVNGGVRILSKHHIRRQATYMYQATEATSDRLAAKGAVCIELDVPGAPGGSVYVVGTHMHAPATPSGHAVRLAQAGELQRFLAGQGIMRDRVVLLAGDFNFDMDTLDAQRALKVRAPQWVPGDATHTVDEASNSLVGIDGSCQRGNGSCRQRVIDGVYAHVGYARNVHVVSTIVAVRSGNGGDLSDHHAATAIVTW